MNFCLSSKQPKKYLSEVSELHVSYHDRSNIVDLGHDYSVPIILEIPYAEEVDWKELNTYNKISNNRLVLKLYNMKLVPFCKQYNIKFFFDYHIKTFAELHAMKIIGVEYIYLDAPLFFKQDEVKEFGLKIRLDPTAVTHSVFPIEDNRYGTWVRPTDIGLYNHCIIEFNNTRDLEQERGWYNIYKDAEWSGALNLIIPGLQSTALNRLIEPSFGERRLNCGQRCKNTTTPTCHFCDTVMTIAENKDKLKELLNKN